MKVHLSMQIFTRTKLLLNIRSRWDWEVEKSFRWEYNTQGNRFSFWFSINGLISRISIVDYNQRLKYRYKSSRISKKLGTVSTMHAIPIFLQPWYSDISTSDWNFPNCGPFLFALFTFLWSYFFQKKILYSNALVLSIVF